MANLENGQQLLELFGDIESAGYVNSVLLKDTKVGFSVQKKYPNNIRFKPARTPQGEDDDIAVIWVVYEQNRTQTNNQLVPIRLRAATLSKYRAKNWDYDFSDENCPTEESVIASSKTPQPLDINLTGAYFFNTERDELVDEDGKQVNGCEILNSMFEKHCDTSHSIRGIPIRTKQQAHQIRMRFYEYGIRSAKWLLKNLFGRTLDEQQDRITYLHGYQKEDFKRTQIENFEIAGYKATKTVIVLFAFIVSAIAFFILPVDENTYIGNILKSELLTALHCLAFLFILDVAVPNVIFFLMNRLFRWRSSYINSIPK